mmetsp:Transcript_27009/g.57224  ORF Transcript_27009/g.57224 Transcript_27009/m.57224 type:complete len:199 (-) Transcript_27009:144-740(-)
MGACSAGAGLTPSCGCGSVVDRLQPGRAESSLSSKDGLRRTRAEDEEVAEPLWSEPPVRGRRLPGRCSGAASTATHPSAQELDEPPMLQSSSRKSDQGRLSWLLDGRRPADVLTGLDLRPPDLGTESVAPPRGVAYADAVPHRPQRALQADDSESEPDDRFHGDASEPDERVKLEDLDNDLQLSQFDTHRNSWRRPNW